MGTGDIPSGGQRSANALAVFGGATASPIPEPRDGFVAWPPPGFIPYQLVFARWSFSLRGADFSDAQVVMTIDGKNQSIIVEDIRNGFGDNTFVWLPDGMSDSAAWPRPTNDSLILINLSNVKVGNETKSFTYQVTVIDP